MRVIPAIDIKEGRVVRLAQGRFDKETVYSDSPLSVAERWASYDIGLIHIVDLDGALKGRLKNLDVIKEIASGIKPKVELGGGIRDQATIEKALRAGIEKVVIGTRALEEGFLESAVKNFKDSIVVGIDARDGFVCTDGWVSQTKTRAVDLIDRVQKAGVRTVNYTDISRDGMLEGPNFESLKEILGATKLEIVASGGVSTLDDVKRLKALEKDGLAAIIIGKALYEGRIDLGEAIKICAG